MQVNPKISHFESAAIQFSGIPESPKPPNISVELLLTPKIASFMFLTILFIILKLIHQTHPFLCL